MGGFSNADLAVLADLSTLDYYHAMIPDADAARDREARRQADAERHERLVASLTDVFAVAQHDPRFVLEVR